MKLFEITNHEKIWYASYLMKANAKVQWQPFRDTRRIYIPNFVLEYELINALLEYGMMLILLHVV